MGFPTHLVGVCKEVDSLVRKTHSKVKSLWWLLVLVIHFCHVHL